MLVHVKYGNKCWNRVMEFSSNHIITVNNAIEKAKLTYGRFSTLQLFNEHGSYTYRRLPWKGDLLLNGVAPLKPSSPSPPTSYTPPNEHHEYLYISVVAVAADGCAVPTHTCSNHC